MTMVIDYLMGESHLITSRLKAKSNQTGLGSLYQFFLVYMKMPFFMMEEASMEQQV